MTYCAVKGCHNSSHHRQKHLKITLHGFPSDPIIAALWIEKLRLNRKENCWKPSKYTKICSMHFDQKEKYFTKGGLCKLHKDAVPSKNLHLFCTEEGQNNKDADNSNLHELGKLVSFANTYLRVKHVLTQVIPINYNYFKISVIL